jgi:predicted Na+-dependent transporter
MCFWERAMTEVLTVVARLSVLVIVVTSMLTVGLSVRGREVLAPLGRARLMLLALIANFALAPLLAYGLARLVGLSPAHTAGLLLLGGAAGAPFLPKLAELARGDVAFSVSLMFLLTVGTVFFMPFVLPLLIPGLEASPWNIARPILLQMALPLAVGLLVQNRSGRLAARLKPILSRVTNASLVLLTVLLLGLNAGALAATVGSGASAASALFVSLCLGAGYLMGGPDREARKVLALGTAQRNVAAALVTASNSFTDPGVVVMLLVATLVGLILILLLARYSRSRDRREERNALPAKLRAAP